MPKVFDRKTDKIEDIKNNKCYFVERSERYIKCYVCDEKSKITYYCLDSRDSPFYMCDYCIYQHIIKENNLYECEKCEDLYDDKNDLNFIESHKLRDFYALCDECIKKM